ncbi:MAG: flagellar hook-basal body complex protein FliE, partial [Planctomycetes bacterium]|nr:flagellar hook-basal body complex protein FliE [Planctomycetota bacterium]
DNVGEVFSAMKKSGLAYQTLLQIRNKLMEAYDEIKRMNV